MENPITDMRIEALKSEIEKLQNQINIQQEEMDLLSDRIQFLETLHETNNDESLDEDDELLDWAERGLVHTGPYDDD